MVIVGSATKAMIKGIVVEFRGAKQGWESVELSSDCNSHLPVDEFGGQFHIGGARYKAKP